MIFNLRLRIVLLAVTGLAILVLVFAATVGSTLRVRGSINHLTTLHLAAETLRAVDNGLLSLEANERGYFLTGDSTLLAPYDSALSTLRARMDTLRLVRAAMPAQAGRLEALDSLVSVRVAELNAALAAYNGRGGAAAVRQIYRNDASRATDSLRATLHRLNLAAEAQRTDLRQHSLGAARTLILAEVLGGLLALALMLTALRRISADLDAREQAEASLRRSERFLDSVIDLMPLMVSVKDSRDLRYVRVNRVAEQLLRLPRESVLGREDADLFPMPIAEGMATIDRAVLASDQVRDIPEEVVVAPDGGVRTLHTRKVAIRDDAGLPAYLLAVSEDITDRKRAEAEILRARETAEAASRAKSEFLARMSHELRTPLNSIIGFSQLIEEESYGPLNDRQRRYVSNVLVSGRQLLDLINDVLDLSKVEAGRMELSLAPVEPLPMLDEALAQFEALAASGQLRLVLDAEPGLPAILVDVTRFRQVLTNLLGNAVKFTPPGGVVTLRASRIPARSPSDPALLRITVQDTGAGIRPEDLERIFREFEQVDGDGVQAQKGTGLGLALARRLTELHGGRLWVESEFGFGASFHVELPASPGNAALGAADEPVPAGTASWAAPAPTPETASLILVVEDDAGIAELLGHYLEDTGFRVAHAGGGEQALEMALELGPDAITLDILIPGGNGLATLRALKEDPRIAPIPVVVVSVIDQKVRGVTLGAFDWLVKPVQRDALVATIRRALASASEHYPLVLAMDDDPGALDVISAILEGAGVRVVTTTDPEHGLQLAEVHSPAAIILDLNMPGLSGFEVVTALRAMPSMKDVPIVIYSGRDFAAADRARLEPWVQRVVAKPDAVDLVAALRRIGLAGRR